MDSLAPLASLISKSEKALQKLTPGTWQHARLQVNLAALRLATVLTDADGALPEGVTQTDLQAALSAMASMIRRVEGVRAKFAPGTSHHSLQRNRLAALREAEARLTAALTGLDRAY